MLKYAALAGVVLVALPLLRTVLDLLMELMA